MEEKHKQYKLIFVFLISYMASNDWIMPVLLTGGLAIGGIMLLPTLMKSLGKGSTGTSQDSYSPEEVEEFMTKYKEDILSNPDAFRTPPKIPLVEIPDIFRIGRPEEDDAYLITDEDFRRLDIGKKDRRFLNRQRKLKDARLERVLYGDNTNQPYILPFSGNVNTVSPYGLAPSKEFTRLSGSEGLSRSNTRGNTLNLY